MIPDSEWVIQLVVRPRADEHHRWLTRILADSHRLLMVVEADGKPAGSIRLDRLVDDSRPMCYELAIAVAPSLQGQGIGTAALRMVRAMMPGAVLDATVLAENKPSLALFRNAGFTPVADDVYRSTPIQALS